MADPVWKYPGTVDATSQYGYVTCDDVNVFQIPLATAEISLITRVIDALNTLKAEPLGS